KPGGICPAGRVVEAVSCSRLREGLPKECVMRLMMCAVAGLAAAGPVVGQSAAPASAERDREAIGQVMLYKAAQAGAPSSGGGVGGGGGGGAGGGVGGFTVLQPSAQSSPAGAGAEYTVHWAQPGPDAT